jgi:hypothetical protein
MAILLCTSLRPSPRTRTFCNDLVAAYAGFSYYLRGKTSLLLLSAYAHGAGADRLWIVNSRFGEPKLVECYDTTGKKPTRIASLLMQRVTLRRELPNVFRGRGGSIQIAMPEAPRLEGLHALLEAATGQGAQADGAIPTTEIRISPHADCLAELTFIHIRTGSFCGPKILLRDVKRWHGLDRGESNGGGRGDGQRGDGDGIGQGGPSPYATGRGRAR